MSLNTAHTSNGVLLHTNEYILLYIPHVFMKFYKQTDCIFRHTKKGCLFMTSHRLIFNNRNAEDLLQSLSLPYVALIHFQKISHIIDPEYIIGSLQAQPNGNFFGLVEFDLYFKTGVTEFFKTLERVCKLVKECNIATELPAYTPADGWVEIAIECWQKPKGHYEWLPEHVAFAEVPYMKVFTCLRDPPFAGIGAPPRYEPKEEPKIINTCTPCARYNSLSQAPGAIGFGRVYPNLEPDTESDTEYDFKPKPKPCVTRKTVSFETGTPNNDRWKGCLDTLKRPCDSESDSISDVI